MKMNSLQRFCKHIKNMASFDPDTLNEAMAKLESYGENSPAALARILISDHDYDPDEVHLAVAKYYAFGEVTINPEALDKNQLCQIKFLHERLDPGYLAQLLDAKHIFVDSKAEAKQ